MLLALAVVAAALFWKLRNPIYVTVFAKRLAAEDVTPEDAVRLSFELMARDPGEARVEAAGPRARVRYRIATDFENARATVREAKSEKDLPAALERAGARVRAMSAEVAADVKTPEGRRAAADLLAHAKDGTVRQRAATALGLGGAEALEPLRKCVREDGPDVGAYAYMAACGVATPDQKWDVMADALATKGLRNRALTDIQADGSPRGARLVVAMLERSDLAQPERTRGVIVLESVSGQKLGDDVAAWKAWAARQP